MSTDSFPPWVTRVRNDPLGYAGYNRLIERSRWAESMFLKEHISTNIGGGAGEHNAAEVPREVGTVELVGGPAYSPTDFRHATGASRLGLGTCALALDSNVYTSMDEMTVQLQNMSETGATKPCLSTFIIISNAEIRFYHQALTSALGAGNAWAAEDADFCVAIHGSPATVGLPGTTGLLKQRGVQLTEADTDYNAQVQFDADVRAKFELDHSAAGLHLNREVAQTWANFFVKPGGGAYDVAATSPRNPLSISRTGLGHVQLTNTNAWTLSAQPLVTTDYQRSNGGSETDIYATVTPRSLVTTTTIDVYIYKYDAGAMTWGRADTDFYIAVHAGV